MFIGHFAVGLAAKRAAPRASLPVLLLAPQLLDVAWPVFCALGVEQVRIVPGFTAASPLELVYMPYSHSLIAAVVWAAVFMAGYLAATRDRRGCWVLGLCVLSHWLLDWISHTPDMPILHGGGPRYGLGLWRSLPGTLVVELAMFAIGVWVYASQTRGRDRRGTIGWWVMVGVLALAFVGATLGPPPPSADAMIGVAFAGLVVLPLAWWIDRHREPAPGAAAAA
jgi:hypothetical protein